MNTAIRTGGLSKRFGAAEALSGRDLHMEAGEVFGYLRPNGAGKTTTIRLLLDATSSARRRWCRGRGGRART
jgi:ABC-type multidrug transport system ATPase subunit